MAKTKSPLTERTAGQTCPKHLVDDLVAHSFSQADVQHWTAEKARVVLAKFAKQKNLDLARSDGTAKRIDGVEYPPPQSARDEAAGWISRAMASNNEIDLIWAIEHGVGCLENKSLHKLAEFLIKRLRTPCDMPPDPTDVFRNSGPSSSDGEREAVADERTVAI